jgi:hypothetical protein
MNLDNKKSSLKEIHYEDESELNNNLDQYQGNIKNADDKKENNNYHSYGQSDDYYQ